MIAAVLLAACSEEGPVPAEVDSGFSFEHDAFAFANFAHNDNGFDLTPDLTARMCGVKLACANRELPCVATDTAAGWTAGVNQTLFEGRSEGFAVLSQLFSLGKLKPSDFGADSAAELTLQGNAKLQAELAYWAGTQSVPSALAHDKHFAAKDVMPFLAKALARGDDERYRLAIAIKTETGFERGHALVPIGYYRVNHEGVYSLRVYDSNFPQSERELSIDTHKNTWRYEVPLDEKQKLVYEGTAENGNQLYFSAITPRMGELVCPFDEASDQASAATVGKIQASIGYGDSERAGFEGGKLVEHGSSRVTPAFANCPTCNPSSGILNFTMPSKGEDLNVVLSAGVAMGTDKEKTGAEVNVTTPKGRTEVKGIKGDPSKKDQLTVKQDGTVMYESDSGSEVSLKNSTTVNGKEQTISVQVAAPDGDAKTTSVTLSADKNGRYSVDTQGFAKGTEIQVTYETTDDKGMKITASTTIRATGSPGAVKIDPKDGEFFSADTGCKNGMWDKDFEWGVDCGDSCGTPCKLGAKCEKWSDCEGAKDLSWYRTVTDPHALTSAGDIVCAGPDGMKTCQITGCMDGVLDHDELNVDCGIAWAWIDYNPKVMSYCGPCKGTNDATAQKCNRAADCDTKICSGGGCRAANPVYLKVSGGAAGQTLELSATLDGVTTTRTLMLTDKADAIKVGDAYAYALSVSKPPSGRYCGFTQASGPRTLTASGHTGYDASSSELDRTLAMNCTTDAGSLDVTTSGLPASAMVQLNARIAGKDQLVSIAQNGKTTIKAAGSYQLSIATQPGQMLISGAKTYVRCDFTSGTSATTSVEGVVDPGIVSTATLTCQQLTCPNQYCTGELVANVSGLPSGKQVGVKVTFPGGTATTTNLTANGTTSLLAKPSAYTLQIVSQPGEYGALGSQSYTECKFDGQYTSTSGNLSTADLTQNITCTTTACPNANCTGSLLVAVTGLPANGTVKVQAAIGATTGSNTFTTNTTAALIEKKGSYTLSITQQPGFVQIAGKQNFVACKWSNDMTSLQGTLDTADLTQTLTCTATMCPAPECSVSCTIDSDCGNSDCECGVNSGNCTGQTGKCGEARAVFKTPTTDGVAKTGTFTVPSGCSQLLVEAWGAGGGAGEGMSMFGPPMTYAGGAGGSVTGYLDVSEGDVFDVWIGQGGIRFGASPPSGTPSIGSDVGTIASGGEGEGSFADGSGGGGGGLTSILWTSSAPTTIRIPAGGGASGGMPGYPVGMTQASELTSAGGTAQAGMACGGGGAGELGGSAGDGYQLGGSSGTYSTLPSGLSSSDGDIGGIPANTSLPDRSDLCGNNGGVGAGEGGSMTSGTDYGGNGCVILRCKAL